MRVKSANLIEQAVPPSRALTNQVQAQLRNAGSSASPRLDGGGSLWEERKLSEKRLSKSQLATGLSSSDGQVSTRPPVHAELLKRRGKQLTQLNLSYANTFSLYFIILNCAKRSEMLYKEKCIWRITYKKA